MPRLRLTRFLSVLLLAATVFVAFRFRGLTTAHFKSEPSLAGILDDQLVTDSQPTILEEWKDRTIVEGQYTKRIIAVGDIHSDFGNALKVLHMADVVDEHGNWTGNVDMFVQTGDIIDRGLDTMKLFFWMEKLRQQALSVGGEVVSHLGNHEWMNLLADWRYVYPEEIKTFGSVAARQKMLQTGRIGKAWAANYSVTSRVPFHPSIGTTNLDFDPSAHISNPLAHAALSFVHGGLSPTYPHLTPYPSRINGIGRQLLRKLQEREMPPPHPPAPYAGLPNDATGEEHRLYGQDGPLWYRGWAQDPDQQVCQSVDEVLKKTGVRRLIMGHTPNFQKIISRCNGKIIIIDTGISHAYGGALSALSIKYTLAPHPTDKGKWTERELIVALYPNRQEVVLAQQREIEGKF